MRSIQFSLTKVELKIIYYLVHFELRAIKISISWFMLQKSIDRAKSLKENQNDVLEN